MRGREAHATHNFARHLGQQADVGCKTAKIDDIPRAVTVGVQLEQRDGGGDQHQTEQGERRIARRQPVDSPDQGKKAAGRGEHRAGESGEFEDVVQDRTDLEMLAQRKIVRHSVVERLRQPAVNIAALEDEQQQASRQAEEKTQFALARIDKLEQEVFGAQGCKKARQECPTVPTHVELIRQMVTDEKPPSSPHLIRLLDSVLESMGAGKSKPEPEQVRLTQSSSLPAAAPNPDEIEKGKARALVYVQIYDEASRPGASALIERLRQAGISHDGTPGIENVTRSAEAKQAKPPLAFERHTVLYFHGQDQALAQWIGGQIDPAHPQGVRLQRLSGHEKSVKPGQIEVWLRKTKP